MFGYGLSSRVSPRVLNYAPHCSRCRVLYAPSLLIWRAIPSANTIVSEDNICDNTSPHRRCHVPQKQHQHHAVTGGTARAAGGRTRSHV